MLELRVSGTSTVIAGAAAGVRDASKALGAHAVFARNVVMLLAGASLTLIVQQEFGRWERDRLATEVV